jgi:hypothetical protein
MKKNNKFVVTIAGQPTGFGLAGLFGSKRGYLIQAPVPHFFGGEKSALKAVDRLNAARLKIRRSVIHDWAMTKPLFADGDIKVEPAQKFTS